MILPGALVAAKQPPAAAMRIVHDRDAAIRAMLFAVFLRVLADVVLLMPAAAAAIFLVAAAANKRLSALRA